MQSMKRKCAVVALLAGTLALTPVLLAAYRDKHPYESGEKHIAYGEWHQYRLYPQRATTSATIKVRANAPKPVDMCSSQLPTRQRTMGFRLFAGPYSGERALWVA